LPPTGGLTFGSVPLLAQVVGTIRGTLYLLLGAVAVVLLNMGVTELSIGDTIGVATPRQINDVFELLFRNGIRPDQLALHAHDTRGTALPNILHALQLGITTFDASSGGAGGCPFAPGAGGNVATEDLVYMLHGMGIETGIDLERLVEAARLAEQIVGRPLPGKVHQAGTRTRRG